MIVGSKTRVAPIKLSKQINEREALTVPKLELLACYILSTLMETISSALEKDIEISGREFWTDSMINLGRRKIDLLI